MIREFPGAWERCDTEYVVDHFTDGFDLTVAIRVNLG